MKGMDALIKRLEAAEKECYCLKVLDSARCEKINSYVITNARLTEERDALRAELAKQQALTEAAQKLAQIAQCRANDACAKIDAMHQQEPVVWTTELALRLGKNAIGFTVSGVNLWGDKGVPLVKQGAQGEVK